jgi:hypothetical protein
VYDGASNMCGAWNGLQALFLRDCPYTYYVHCFAHRLQLALVGATGNEISIWLFFSKLTTIIKLSTLFVLLPNVIPSYIMLGYRNCTYGSYWKT